MGRFSPASSVPDVQTYAEPGELAARGALHVGQVAEVLDEGALAIVDVDGRSHRAAIAVGCLVRPLAEDRVLVVLVGAEAFVLNVLERPAPNYATLALPGRGNLAIEGETVTLSSRQRLALRADAMDLRANALTVAADKTTWLGRLYTLIVERLRSSAKIQEASADTMTVKAVDRVAIVDRADSVQAGAQSTKIETVSTTTAQSAVIAVVDDLRIDGKRVSVG